MPFTDAQVSAALAVWYPSEWPDDPVFHRPVTSTGPYAGKPWRFQLMDEMRCALEAADALRPGPDVAYERSRDEEMERDRLREVNAELLVALKSIIRLNDDGYPVNNIDAGRAYRAAERDAWRTARTVITKAEAGS